MSTGHQGNGSGEAALKALTTQGDRVGEIFGDVTTAQFKFLVGSRDVTATMYISFALGGEPYLAQVLHVEREAGDGDDRLVAKAKVVGRRNDRGLLETPSTPPKPGSPVHRASPELVRSALNLSDRGAYLGRLRGLDLEVRLDVNELVQKHCSILAKTGAGKSYALGVLMEELLKNEVPIVVIDPHGEHASLSAPNSSDREVPMMRRFKVRPKSYADRVVEYAADSDAVPDAIPYTLDGRDLSARDLSQLLGGSLTSAQTGVLHQAVKDLEDAGSYTLDDIIDRVEEQSGSSKWPVLEALEDLRDLDILSTEPTSVRELVAKGQATILNLKGAAPHVQDLIVARITRELFEARKVGLVAPHMCVVEEAHNFCPERNMQKAASGEIIRTIASEGRKFGMGLAVISQRPAKIEKNVLSQCNTQIILKVTNKNDLRAISQSVEGLPPGMEDEIQALPVGTALVSEPTIAVPLFCEIRPRETRHGGASISVVKDDTPEPEPVRIDPEPEPAQAVDVQTVDADPGTGHHPSLDPVPEPVEVSPETRMLGEAERAEETLAGTDLAGFDPGTLERLLIEVEGLITVLGDVAEREGADIGRIAGVEQRLRNQARRLRAEMA